MSRAHCTGMRTQSSGLEAVLELLAPSLLAYANRHLPMRARTRVDPEDLVQDAFLALWARREWIDGVTPRAVRAYLYTSVANRIRDELRHARVAAASEPQLRHFFERQPEMAERLDARPLGRLLHRALQETPAADRLLLIGRLVFELRFRQLARLGRAPNANAARQRFLRALGRLRDRFGSVAGLPTGAAEP